MAEITKEQEIKIEIYDVLEKEAILQIQLKNLNEYKQKKMEELSNLRREASKNTVSKE